MEVEERLAALSRLDHKITNILAKGVQVIRAVSNGKQAGGDNDRARNNVKDDFKRALEEYNGLIQVINSELRSEVKKLHEASSTDVLPLNLPTLACDFGHDKETELWNCIYQSLESMEQDEMEVDKNPLGRVSTA